MDRTQELEEQVQRLTARVARLEGGEPGHQSGKEPRSRRGFLKFGAGAVMGAVGMAAAKVMPAAATAGDTMIIGGINRSGAPTFLTGDINVATTGPDPVLQVNPQGVNSSSLATVLNGRTLHGALRGFAQDGAFEGVDAWASGSTGTAVFGLSDTGTGVVGETDGVGLFARRSGRIRQDGQTAAGAPNYTPGNFEQVRDSQGALWIHGTTGVGQARWRRVNSLRTDTADGTGAGFKPLRLVDTRSTGGPAGDGASRTYTAAPAGTGASTIPADAIAVVGNLTAVGFSPAGGYLAIVPAGVAYNPATDASSLNFSTGAYAWANTFVCGLGVGLTNGGKLTVYVSCFAGTTNFIIDITGYIQ